MSRAERPLSARNKMERSVPARASRTPTSDASRSDTLSPAKCLFLPTISISAGGSRSTTSANKACAASSGVSLVHAVRSAGQDAASKKSLPEVPVKEDPRSATLAGANGRRRTLEATLQHGARRSHRGRVPWPGGGRAPRRPKTGFPSPWGEGGRRRRSGEGSRLFPGSADLESLP